MGALVAVVLWMITMAFLWALVLSQSQSSALTGVVRVSALATVLHSARSAITEASAVLRHPPDTGSPVLKGILGGQTAGDACDPAGTRALYADDVQSGALKLEAVKYVVAHRGSVTTLPGKRPDPWLIDLTARVRYAPAGTECTRQVRRRIVGDLCEIREAIGPDEGKVVFSYLIIREHPVVEVLEP